MITKLVDRMIGQEILESEKRDEYIYALTIRAEQVITYTLLAMVCIMAQLSRQKSEIFIMN